MEQIEKQLAGIQQKVQELGKKYAALQKQYEQQSDIIVSLRKEQSDNISKIRLLEEQQLVWKSAAGQMSGTDKKALEQHLNKYIKEIDKCIALMSE